jgi:hypothetical protein
MLHQPMGCTAASSQLQRGKPAAQALPHQGGSRVGVRRLGRALLLLLLLVLMMMMLVL